MTLSVAMLLQRKATEESCRAEIKNVMKDRQGIDINSRERGVSQTRGQRVGQLKSQDEMAAAPGMSTAQVSRPQKLWRSFAAMVGVLSTGPAIRC